MEGRENGKEVYAVGPGTSEFPLETQDLFQQISSRPGVQELKT